MCNSAVALGRKHAGSTWNVQSPACARSTDAILIQASLAEPQNWMSCLCLNFTKRLSAGWPFAGKLCFTYLSFSFSLKHFWASCLNDDAGWNKLNVRVLFFWKAHRNEATAGWQQTKRAVVAAGVERSLFRVSLICELITPWALSILQWQWQASAWEGRLLLLVAFERASFERKIFGNFAASSATPFLVSNQISSIMSQRIEIFRVMLRNAICLL